MGLRATVAPLWTGILTLGRLGGSPATAANAPPAAGCALLSRPLLSRGGPCLASISKAYADFESGLPSLVSAVTCFTCAMVREHFECFVFCKIRRPVAWGPDGCDGSCVLGDGVLVVRLGGASACR